MPRVLTLQLKDFEIQVTLRNFLEIPYMEKVLKKKEGKGTRYILTPYLLKMVLTFFRILVLEHIILILMVKQFRSQDQCSKNQFTLLEQSL
ncbi:hypothetical protein LCGC14_1054240 [marine sediment metagenome]|uniref:Uncharacterized protein n=1 Tax=marine sediment metagenome TaxID=412755 RepID=A0A0F9N9S3_9ZZZZ